MSVAQTRLRAPRIRDARYDALTLSLDSFAALAPLID